MTDAQLAATMSRAIGGPATTLFADLLAGLDATPDEPVDATPAAATVSRVDPLHRRTGILSAPFRQGGVDVGFPGSRCIHPRPVHGFP
jgi:hypothetical protein